MKIKLLLITVFALLMFAPTKAEETAIKDNSLTIKKSINLQNRLQQRLQVVTPDFPGLLNPSKAPAAGAAITTFPYQENFEITSAWIKSDPAGLLGISVIPGITSVPRSGLNYLASNYDPTKARNAWAYSPAVTLTAGVTYHVYIYAFVPGYSTDKDEFKVTAGISQNNADQTNIIIDKSGANAISNSRFTRYDGTFKPTVTRDYYFAINLCTAIPFVNVVGFENFIVSTNLMPDMNIYYKGGLWSQTSVYNDSVYLSTGETLTHTAWLKDATSSSWNFGSNATPQTSNLASVNVSYSSEGMVKPQLSATGAGGTTSTQNMYYAVIPKANTTTDYVGNVKALYDEMEIISLTTTTYDFMAGPNTYYKIAAEKYTLPDNVTVSVSDIAFVVGSYFLDAATQAKPFTIKIMKADGTGGQPGTVVSTVAPTFAQLFGTTRFDSTPTTKNYHYTTPVQVTGSFYIVMDFSNVTPSASNYIGMITATVRINQECTLYAYYNATYNPVTSLYTNGGYTSSYVFPKLKYITGITTGMALPSQNDVNVYVNENTLFVRNARRGDGLTVYDLSGHTLLRRTLQTENMDFPVSLQRGVYIVKTGEKSTKILVK